eukprot:Pgem_evm1s16412
MKFFASSLLIVASTALIDDVALAHKRGDNFKKLNKDLTPGAKVLKVNEDDWLKECVVPFKKYCFHGGNGEITPPLQYSNQTMFTYYQGSSSSVPASCPVPEDGRITSNYYLKEESSALCNDKLSCAFEQCYWDGDLEKVLQEADLQTASFSEVVKNFPGIPNLPKAVTNPTCASDIVEVLKYANKRKQIISIKNSGHSYHGASNMKNSIQITMRNYPKYSSTGVTLCSTLSEEAKEDHPCKLAEARGKLGVIKIGGGENWNEVYASVHNYNYAFPDRTQFEVLGGGAGSVSAAGGWLQGGGLSDGLERLHGFGVDQVLQIEMVLADGTHVKFSPSKWEKVDGKLYPQTKKVSGKCNRKVSDHESQWRWVDCNKPFSQLWKAVRGGGGGTYGIVTSVHVQLHEFEQRVQIKRDDAAYGALLTKLRFPSYIVDMFPVPDDNYPYFRLQKIFMYFLADMLFNPEAIGLDKETTLSCGSFKLLFSLQKYNTLTCRNKATTQIIVDKWRTHVKKEIELDEVLVAANVTLEMQNILKDPEEVASYQRYLDFDRGVPIGKLPDSEAPGLYPHAAPVLPENPPYVPVSSYSQSVNVPKSFLLQRYWAVNNFLHLTSFTHIMGGNTEISGDGHSAITQAQREAGLQATVFDSFFNHMYNLTKAQTENEYPGMYEYNHINGFGMGGHKADWSAPCAFTTYANRNENTEKCVSIQEGVWGTTLLRELEDIKKNVDPNNIFQCYPCVGFHNFIENLVCKKRS